MPVEPHPLTSNPTAAWAELSKTQKVIKIKVQPPKSDVSSGKVRIATAISNYVYFSFFLLSFCLFKIAVVY